MDSSPSFTFLPPPPNPNPRIFPPYQHQHHHTSAVPTYLPTLSSDLHTTLSTLKHLIHLSKTTIHSVSNLVPTSAAAAATATCPYNSNHRVPPSSLFHHHLQCSSSPAPIDLALLDSLHYPNSLRSQHSSINQKINANTDVCVALDDYHTSLDPNFFYSDCPAVVTFPNDNNNAGCMLTLPVVLSFECANSKADGNDDIRDTIDGLFSSYNFVQLLPSEYCDVRTEINQWNDYPSFYSYCVLRSIVSSYNSQKERLMEWILVNSPFYGVVIDVFMSDHILLLVWFCLKAIAREAIGYLVSISIRELTVGKYRFDCPVLGRVLMWLATQLAILYGEVNGKLFAINMLKQALLIASSKSLFLYGDRRVDESSGLSDVISKAVRKENDGSKTGMIFVSQVASAVAALHERSAFETRIKAIRASRFVPVYQRVQEHGYISMKAEEERSKRSNYKAIIEHDGVLWNRGGNQDGNKNKSREELLAEERDYKRRRMSYRGKKMKRSTTQVMRDIIDEYMEEIKRANMACQPPLDSTKSHKNESVSDVSMTSSRSEDEIKEKVNKHKRDEHYQKYYNLSKNYEGHRSSSRSRDHGQRDEKKHSRKYRVSSPNRSPSRSRDNRQRSRHKDTKSSSVVSNEFEDRYDPSKSNDN